jgi:uncharacterized membrane protein YfcA
VVFTPTLLFLLPALDPGFPLLDVNQAVAMSLIVTFVGYSSATVGYWIQRRVAFDVAAPILMVTVPTAIALSWIGSIIPDRWLLFLFGFILFALAFVLVKFHGQAHPRDCPC